MQTLTTIFSAVFIYTLFHTVLHSHADSHRYSQCRIHIHTLFFFFFMVLHSYADSHHLSPSSVLQLHAHSHFKCCIHIHTLLDLMLHFHMQTNFPLSYLCPHTKKYRPDHQSSNGFLIFIVFCFVFCFIHTCDKQSQLVKNKKGMTHSPQGEHTNQFTNDTLLLFSLPLWLLSIFATHRNIPEQYSCPQNANRLQKPNL